MVNQGSREDTALNRYQVITPILWAMDAGEDPAKLTQVYKEVIEKSGVSRKTLKRWVDVYKSGGFDSLKPVERIYRGPDAIPDALIDEAVALRREVPGRSINSIIEILELEGKAPRGFIKRTTLQDKLTQRGYSTRQVKLYQQDGMAARRYARKERGDLWISDIKFGPHLAINGIKKQIYLVCIMDDATRYVVHAEFYDNQEQSVVEDCLRKAIIKEGAPKRILFDNGKQYRTKWMHRTCAMLDIKLLFTRPYSPESKGKQERFNRTAGSFIQEADLMNITTLAEYNRYFQVWLSESYQNREHSALKTTPLAAYRKSKSELRFPEPETLAAAFLHQEERKVDKSGCISFECKKYEVGITYIGQYVNIIYDPANTEKITIQHVPSNSEFEARELVIGEHTGPRPKVPEFMTPVKASSSRLLTAQEKYADMRELTVKRAIKYGAFVEGGGHND